ncbi:c-type cytochrome [Flavobacterium aciduliphilum]|uniref:Cytochrome c n=1 Tax=Flavobacterium aciduliphilum TaxID=1101402 RepID=A0A328YDR6_9FLAO|nr:c-type cytochrome [Flavobacterium aciduliphilum]RAR71670.1 cytochrome c [Flavobacterium aciduliphilum]
MKAFITTVLFVALFVFTSSCGGKKEDQDFGKKAAKESVQSETVASPMETKGKEIFEGKGTCATCHKPDVKLVGPSLKEIAKIYNEKKASIATFLKGNEKPLVDPSQFEVMKANFALTKNFTDEERQALEAYVLSQGK